MVGSDYTWGRHLTSAIYVALIYVPAIIGGSAG
jgi:hypothetical protein